VTIIIKIKMAMLPLVLAIVGDLIIKIKVTMLPLVLAIVGDCHY
jgi:predicted component of type VI protein secretion system